MTFKVRVFNSETDEREPWWNNFVEYHYDRGIALSNDNVLNKALEPFNAVDDEPTAEGYESDCIIFEDEHDFVLFVLRWS
jgi:hypothetical protein